MNQPDRRAWPREFRDTLEALDAYREAERTKERIEERYAAVQAATARWHRRREIVAWALVCIGGGALAWLVW